MIKKVIVLGGGISGLSVAWKLAESGISVDVIEAKEYVGGLAATIETNGYKMDFGPHALFSEDEKILNVIKNLFDDEIPAGIRDVRLYMDGKYLRYPLNAEDILLKLGIRPSAKCFISFVIEKLRREQKYGPYGPNMEQWSVGQFGKALHELFFKPYTEQFWDVQCNELSPDCIPSYKHMSFLKTLKLLLTPKKRKENLSIIDREMLPLYYPRDGFGSIAERVALRVALSKGRVNKNLRVVEIRRLSNGGFLVKAQTKEREVREFEADYLVTTIPISDFVRMLSPEVSSQVKKAAQKLEYLSLLVLYLVTEKTEVLDCMYEYCLEKPYNRITDVNQFTLVPVSAREGNMLSIEQSCHLGARWWQQSKENLFKTYIPHIEREGILKESEVTDIFLLKASHAYPMYLYGYNESLETFKRYCDTIQTLRICGRTGSFRYMDTDECMKLAFDLADELIKTILK
jgi:protoporphyrinogen oxidase